MEQICTGQIETMCQQKKNKRLRPKVVNPIYTAKEHYYKAKAALTECEIEEMKKRGIREQEEHKQRLILLYIQIENEKKTI